MVHILLVARISFKKKKKKRKKKQRKTELREDNPTTTKFQALAEGCWSVLKKVTMCTSLLFALKAEIEGDILRQSMFSFCCSEVAPCIKTCSASQKHAWQVAYRKQHNKRNSPVWPHTAHSAGHSSSLTHVWMM